MLMQVDTMAICFMIDKAFKLMDNIDWVGCIKCSYNTNEAVGHFFAKQMKY